MPLGLASFILPLCTNVMVTSLIIGRIWYMSRDTSLYVVHANSGTRKAMNIIVESGALYFVAQLVFVVTYAMQHPAEYILLLMVVPIYVSIWLLVCGARAERFCNAGHRLDAYHHPRRPRPVL